MVEAVRDGGRGGDGADGVSEPVASSDGIYVAERVAHLVYFVERVMRGVLYEVYRVSALCREGD